VILVPNFWTPGLVPAVPGILEPPSVPDCDRAGGGSGPRVGKLYTGGGVSSEARR